MPTDLPLRCACGTWRGWARNMAPNTGNRAVCYCNDCQSFPHFLGCADRVLDTHGGTDIFQMSPARLEFADGTDHLACIRLTPTGMFRWYADCCRTPIGNTMASSKMPFVGLIHSCVDHETDGRSRDDTIGPIRARGHARFAKGDRSQLGQLNAHTGAPASVLLRVARMLVVARLRGDHKRSPFFDVQTGKPQVPPHVLGEEELRGVGAARDAW